MDWFLPLIAGLGLGSVIKSVADHFMTRKASEHDRWCGPPTLILKHTLYGKRDANCSAPLMS